MENKFSVKDKVIIVTGATGVLGHSFITALAKEGAKVAVLGRNEKVANERVVEIKQKNGNAIVLVADVTKEDQLLTARQKILVRNGTWLQHIQK